MKLRMLSYPKDLNSHERMIAVKAQLALEGVQVYLVQGCRLEERKALQINPKRCIVQAGEGYFFEDMRDVLPVNDKTRQIKRKLDDLCNTILTCQDEQNNIIQCVRSGSFK